MILQSTDELEKYVGNKYSLVILAAKRSRQLREGHTPLAREASPNPLTQALREIEERQVQAIAPAVEDLPPAPREMITSIVAGADFLDEELDPEDSDAMDDLTALLVGSGIDEDDEDAEDTLEGGTRTADDSDLDGDEEESEESEDTDGDSDDDETSEDE